MPNNIRNILIISSIALIALIFFFLNKSKKDTLASWRTDPAKVDIAISNNKHDAKPLPNATPEPTTENKASVEPAPKEKTVAEPIEIQIEASNISELAEKIKMETGELLSINPYLSPANCKLDLKNYSFSYVLSEGQERKDFLKLGLYFGPTETGCESCRTVLSKNPGSVVLSSGKGNGLVGQVIGLK